MRRWRPPLFFVLGGALAGTLALSFAGLVALRYLGPVIGFRDAAILLALGITLATAVLGWLLVRLLLRPIRALEAYAAAQTRGDRPSPPRHYGTRELHATGQGVIAMAHALRDREASIRAFTDHVTHEIRTPVSAIRAAGELLEDGGALTASDARLVGQIDEARAQIETQLAALRDVARARESRYIGQCTLADLAPGLQAEWPQLTLSFAGETVAFPMAAEGMRVVIGQLLRNAAEHGARKVRLAAQAAGGTSVMVISDDGSGVSDGNAARIFDPFFTTRRAGGGTGMGLTIVRTLLQSHGARISLTRGDPGARFEVRFEARQSVSV